MRFIYAFLTFIGWIAVAYGAPGATSRKGYASNSRIKSAVAQGPSSACINSFYTTANSVLGTCKIDINQATMYVIQQIFKANPGYVKSQCLQYCSAPPPSTASPSVSVSAACQKGIQSAATTVNNACGQEVQAAATSLLAQTYQKNPSFIAAQCLPYCQPASKSFACPKMDAGAAKDGCSPPWDVSTTGNFPYCGYVDPYREKPSRSYSNSDEQCQFDIKTGKLIYGSFNAALGFNSADNCCPQSATS